MVAAPRYTGAFFDEQSAASRASAAAVVPTIIGLTGPLASVLDVGCGVATWLAELRACGVTDIRGVDGAYVDRIRLEIPPDCFTAHDLSEPLRLGRRFDLAMSLEVAEHVPEAAAGTFVASLCRHSDTVLFSAAVPGQGGTGHVNERWPSWWAGRLQEHGFELRDLIRGRIWDDERVEVWYRQNMFLFARGEAAIRLAKVDGRSPLDVAHPQAWSKRRLPATQRLVYEKLRPGMRGPIVAVARRLGRGPAAQGIAGPKRTSRSD